MRIPNHLTYKLVRSFISHFGISKKRPVVVSFTGGMGAQIISAAIYFDLQNQGYDVYADFRYFEEKPSIHPKYSLWDWQLDCFGLNEEHFKRYKIQDFKLITAMYIKDGAIKAKLSSEAMRKSDILNIFRNYTRSFQYRLTELFSGDPRLSAPYVCVHVRRGDYLNVASYLVPEELFLNMLQQVRMLASTLVVISDSPLSEKFKEITNRDYDSTIFYDSGSLDFALSHYVMTSAHILICSNSQFSWTAGKLTKGLVLIPRRWFGERSNSLEILIHKDSHFLTI